MTDEQLAKRYCEILKALCALYDDMKTMTEKEKPKPKIMGNIVALPGVDLEAARRAQRRRRKAVAP